ncbi:pimeloyl-ACP methyl ester carboxylesterase [Larkinella arboricola]|uniref:Pimeloyl-ACP methyl ester carboxylesterase n=1 Tax=Larkinella arboricola TaxID=643671 RepID=A0A327WNU6_LARAB|nr:alpha/beta hydrolase [Larkinella arboricola]RAJ93194.1 pimeloyl-ACP methyl ester carboxylesterase [Larkinella arboricola]
MPLLILAYLIADLLSIAYPIIAYYLWREWYLFDDTPSDAYAQRCLYGAIALLAFILLGRFLIKALLSTNRPQEPEPHMFESDKHDTLKRPDGSTIHIEYYGPEDRQPIIFVHGWNASIKNWYYQRTYFETNYRLIMMDLPGLGKSTRPTNRDFSLDKMAADLKAVIEHTQVRNPILWGHSIGGMTILTLLAKAPNLRQMIKGVILQHTTYTNPVRTILLFAPLMTAIQKPVLVPLCWLLIILSPLIWMSRWMSYLNGNAHIMTRLLTFTGTQTAKQLDFSTLLSTLAPPAVTARGVLGMFQYDVTHELPSIMVPTLVVTANKDRLTKPVASEYMHQHLPHAQLVTVAPGGHQGLLERHQQVNEAAETFIRSLS